MNDYLKTFAALACFLACLAGCRQGDSVPMEQMLQKKFPVGTPAADVEKVLKLGNIEHSMVEKGNAIYAIIRNTGKSSILVKESISVVIYLDDKMQVKEVKIKKAFTGP